MKTIGRLALGVVSLVLALHGSATAQTGDKNKSVRITYQQAAAAEVYINFAADSVLKPTDLAFCRVTGPLKSVGNFSTLRRRAPRPRVSSP